MGRSRLRHNEERPSGFGHPPTGQQIQGLHSGKARLHLPIAGPVGHTDRGMEVSRPGGYVLKRGFDLLLAACLLPFLAIPMLVVAIGVKLSSPGPVLSWSDRVGRLNHIFRMPKFRSMQVGTPQLATHLMKDPARHLTPLGHFLRTSSLDELPQIFSILKGDLSFVGPRPALCNQDDLVELRTKLGVHYLIPGLTGWAQVNGRDELSIPDKVRYDCEYARRGSLMFDCKIIALTIICVLLRWGISH